MATGSDIAKAYVQIIPSADGIQGKLTEVMGGEAEKAGKASGGKFGKAMGTALKVGGAAVTAFAGATAAMTGAIVKGASATAEYGDNIDKMSQKLGLSSTAYQKWDYVLSQSGADINSMGTGLKTLTNKLDDAKNGSESAQAMFAQLGLSMEDLATMSREDVFAATITGFQGMADSTERAALANDLFGKSGQELTPLFNTSVEETQALMAATEELGMIMSDDAVQAAANYQDSLDTLKRTFGGVKNSLMSEFMPSITSVMDGLTALLSGDEGGINQITVGLDAFVAHISQAMPKILAVGSELIVTLANAIVENLPTLLPAALDAISTIGEGLLENLPMIIEVGLQLLLSLAQGIVDALPTLIPTIVEVVLQIVETLTQPDTLSSLIDAAIAIMMALTDGLIEALPTLIERAPEIVANLVDAIVENTPKLLEAAFQIIVAIVRGIIQNLPQMLQSGQDIVNKILSGIGQLFSKLVEQGRVVVEKIGNGLKNAASKALQWGRELVQKVVSGISNAASSLVSAGLNIVEGIWNGISNGYSWITSRISGWVGDVLSYFKRLLKIGSPSKVFEDEVGKWMALGLGEGFVGQMGAVEAMMRKSIPTFDDLVGSPYSGSMAYGGRLSPSYNYGGVTINILGREKDAEQLAVELQAALVRRTAVWA